MTLSDPTGEKPDECALIGVSCRLKDNGGWTSKPTPVYKKYYMLDKTPAQRKAVIVRTRANVEQSRAVLAAKELGKIVQDELGITDALDCFSTGSLGSCGATILNVVTSAIGAKIGQLAKKYVWNWKKGIALAKRVWGLLSQLKSSYGKWRTLDKKADKLEDAAEKSCASNSFTPTTKVLMADGTTKSIRDVDIGDKVLATDPKTGKTKVRTVTAEIKGKGPKNLVKITLAVDGKKSAKKSPKTASVTATDGHPFWVPELGKWLDATDLRSGQWLRTSAGTYVQVAAVERWTQSATVHNLTVADLHTYYVGAGAAPVLVHNSNSNCVVGGAPGGRPGKPFTPAGKGKVLDENQEKYGVPTCEICGKEVVRPQKSQRGVTPPENEWQIDHIQPKSRGGSGDPSNGQVLCRVCNREKSDN